MHKKLSISSIEIAENYADFNRSNSTDELIVVPTPNGKYRTAGNLHRALAAIAKGQKSINAMVLPNDLSTFVFLKYHPVVPGQLNEAIITALHSLEFDTSFKRRVSSKAGAEIILHRLSKAINIPVENLRKLYWVWQEGSSDLVREVMAGKDLDEAIDELFTVAA